MEGETYTLRTGKYFGKELKDVPASYLLYLYDQDYVMEKAVRNFVFFNEKELREKAKTEKK